MGFSPNREMVFRYLVLPPAAYFSRGRKVGKSPLRTYGSKNSLVFYRNLEVREAFGRWPGTGDAGLGGLLLLRRAPR